MRTRCTGKVSAPVETCPTCRFDGRDYGIQDALGTLRAASPMWRQTVEGVGTETLERRPGPTGWSAAEYAAHTADVVQASGQFLHGMLTIDDLEGERVPEHHVPDVTLGFEAALDRLEANLARFLRGVDRVGPARDPRWERTAVLDGVAVDVLWVLRHVVHDVTHHLHDAGRALHALGAGAPSQVGAVAQLSVSDGGVPKQPVPIVDVGYRGLQGDRQAARKHHGRPLQALCLWSAEVIDALQGEGHPIGPGCAGENITLTGIDWSTIRPGTQLRVGEVLAEVSAWATPCYKNAQWFLGGDIARMGHDTNPGWSRAYAWVREPGTIREGDDATVEP